MSATFSRLKTWISEKLTSSDLNAEIDNILTNLSPSGMSGSSANVAGMQVQTDPGEVGSESLATTLAGEIERLRYEVAEIKGADSAEWYSSPPTSLSEINNALGEGGLPDNRLSSGTTTGNSSQSLLLVPQGAGIGNDLTIDATTADLNYFVAGTQVIATADIALAFTQTGPTTNNTALVNDVALADGDSTKRLGVNDIGIPIDNVGSEITSLNGEIAAFRLDNGVDSEYFLARVNTTDGYLQGAKRGWFFDEAGALVPAVTIADNDTIYLMQLTWVFLTNAKTILSTNNTPIISVTEPSSASSGDFWFDISGQIWKRFNGSIYADSESVYVGVSVQDENGDCAAARSEDFYFVGSSRVTLEPLPASVSTVTARAYSSINVGASSLNFLHDNPLWDMATDLDTGITEAASTRYFMYMKEDGTEVISDVAPTELISERKGHYHPGEMWRVVAYMDNDGSSDLTDDTLVPYPADTRRVKRYLSAGTSGHSTSSTTLVDVSGTEMTLVSTGRPLLISVINQSTNVSSITLSSSIEDAFAFVNFMRNGSLIFSTRVGLNTTGKTSLEALHIPHGALSFIDYAPPGIHEYKIQASVGAGTHSISFFHVRLTAVEL